MDALGAHTPEPDDSYLFNAIVASLDIDESAVEQAAAADSEPASAAEPDTVDAPAPAPEPAPVQELAPAALPQPAAPPPAAAAGRDAAQLAPPLELDIEEPPELVVPPRPVRAKSMIDWCATAFPHLVWLSVIAGLLGQVYGWSKVFGGGAVGWVVAGIFGGVFEFIMVAASSKGLKDLGLGRAPAQVAAFLAVGTACAVLAFGMNLTHFTGSLKMAGIAAAAATALGYLAHVGVHWFEELDNRRDLAEWKKRADAITREIKAREERLRAEHEIYQAKQRELRLRQLEAYTPKPAAPAEAPAPEPRPAPAKPAAAKPAAKTGQRAAKKTGKPELARETVLEWVRTHSPNAGPADVRKQFAESHAVPTDRTLRRWLNGS